MATVQTIEQKCLLETTGPKYKGDPTDALKRFPVVQQLVAEKMASNARRVGRSNLPALVRRANELFQLSSRSSAERIKART